MDGDSGENPEYERLLGVLDSHLLQDKDFQSYHHSEPVPTI